ncbi:cytochrome P450 71D11-like [Prosopis cineraria]|uniref:cytochrome P450 71D11-like n=1 Tax=Prosopis cineraria TaxID=364024 RepID=UPI00240FA1A5|nr:cytochrome P450 71D11-like [Prosopis cineraria]
MTFAIVTKVAFGDTCKDQEAFISVAKEMVTMVRLQGFSVNDMFPSQKWLDVITGERRRFKEIHRKCDALLQKFVDERVSRSRDEDGTDQSLLCDLLYLRDDSGSEGLSRVTINNDKAVILDVFIAGTDSSLTLLQYAVLELLRNPGLLKRAQAEVRQVSNKQGHVREEELDELK